MRPGPNEVVHFSEDPTITTFIPRFSIAHGTSLVWATSYERACDYWFPRECPRAMAWAEPDSTTSDRAELLGEHGRRVHVVEQRWIKPIRSSTLFGYRLPAALFYPLSPNDSVSFGSPAWVCSTIVTPLADPEPVGDLIALHDDANIELRVVDNLWPFINAVTASSLGFSCIRTRNALPAESP